MIPAPVDDQSHIHVQHPSDQVPQPSSAAGHPSSSSSSTDIVAQLREAAHSESPKQQHKEVEQAEQIHNGSLSPDRRQQAQHLQPFSRETNGEAVRGPPPPADFTHYHTSSGTAPLTERIRSPSRKRSISATEDISNASSNHPIISAARQAAIVANIDPSLADSNTTIEEPPSKKLSSPQRSAPTWTPTNKKDATEASIGSNSNTRSANDNKIQSSISSSKVNTDSIASPKTAGQTSGVSSENERAKKRKEERKQTLEREALRMREALEAKEKEIRALEENGLDS